MNNWDQQLHGKIKICFFMAGSYPVFAGMKSGFGGAEINLFYLSTGLAKTNEFEVHFIVGDYGQPRNLTIENVHLKRVKFLNPSKYRSYFHKILARLHFCLLLARDTSDIYICSTASDFFGFIVLFSKLLLNKKVVFRAAHDWDVNGYFTKSKSIIGFFHRFALPKADVIIAQNEDQKRKLKEVENLDSVVIRNGFPLEEHSANKDKKYFLWVARADDFKQPHLYLELAKSLCQHQFLMILAGENALAIDVTNKSKNISNLKVINGCGFFDTLDYFKNAKCLINTSSEEGFPNTFIQAGFTKTPILSLNVNPDGILEHYKMGCCSRGDLGTAKDFLNSLTEEKILTLGSNAFNYVKMEHNLNDKIKEYIAVLRSKTQK